MSGLKIHILKLKSLYFTMLLFKYIKTLKKKKKLPILNFMFICLLYKKKKKKKKNYKELEFTKLEFHKNIKNYLFLSLCLFVNYPKKKKVVRDSSLPSSSSILQGTQAW